MSDLDDKLRDIIERYSDTDAVELVPAVKQAFSEAGYVKPAFEVTGYSTSHDMIEPELMTGQEWYDRFVKELDDDLEPEDHLDGYRLKSFLAAAKKAAGLDS